MFRGKKILFFSANFFGYQIDIKMKLEALGAEVDFYDERPSNSFWTKALIRFDKRILKNSIERYYENIIEKTKAKKYDFVFFLKAEGINRKMLIRLKEVQNNARYILYMWDSIQNSSADIKSLFPLFDKIFSFDREDSINHNEINFRPLFYIDEYSRMAEDKGDFKYDICFIGTGHTDRYQLISKLRKECDKNNLKFLFFVFLQDRRIFWLNKLSKKSYKRAKMNEFSFSPLGKKEMIEIINNSKCVLDIQREVQTGLTMRTIEMLGAKKKLITTNKDIKHYDFYNESNIDIIERENPKINVNFIKQEYVEVPDPIYMDYSIQNWLMDIFRK